MKKLLLSSCLFVCLSFVPDFAVSQCGVEGLNQDGCCITVSLADYTACDGLSVDFGDGKVQEEFTAETYTYCYTTKGKYRISATHIDAEGTARIKDFQPRAYNCQ